MFCLLLKQIGDRKFAWPNIWANQYIVPELIGKITVKEVADLVIDYLNNPEKLKEIRQQLQAVRGHAGAASKIVLIVKEMCENS